MENANCFPKHISEEPHLPPLTAENERDCSMCYYLCNAYCRQVKSLSCQYTKSTPYRCTNEDDI